MFNTAFTCTTIYTLGSRPQESKLSVIRVKFGEKKGEGINRWAVEVQKVEDSNVTVSITPGADSLIGRYHFYVETHTSDNLEHRQDFDDEFIILFNAWCEGTVY